MAKPSLLKIARTIAGHTEIAELAAVSDIANQAIRDQREKVGRLLGLTTLSEAQHNALQTLRAEARNKLGDINFKIEDLYRQERETLLRALHEEERIILNPNDFTGER